MPKQKQPKKSNGELDMRYKINRIKQAESKKRPLPKIPLQERKFERLDLAKMKLPIQRKTSKSNTYQTLYTDEKGRRISKANWYAKFKTPDGVPLTVEEVDFIITATRQSTDAKDIFEVFKFKMEKTKQFTDYKSYNTTVELSLIDSFLLENLQTYKGKIKGLPLQMGYLNTLKNDAIEEIQSRFKNEVKILGVAFDLSYENNSDTAILGDSIRVRIYGKKRSVKKIIEKVGEYVYSISTGKVTKTDISDYWD